MESKLNNLCPNSKIIPIKQHKLGPVHAVLQAKEFIDDYKPAIINYCDFSWAWNYEHFKKIVKENKKGQNT